MTPIALLSLGFSCLAVIVAVIAEWRSWKTRRILDEMDVRLGILEEQSGIAPPRRRRTEGLSTKGLPPRPPPPAPPRTR